MSRTVELHFQEGFTGETVVLEIGRALFEAFEAQTRTQIGLARVVTLDIETGQTVTVDIPDLEIRETYTIEPDDTWIKVNLVGGKVIVEPAQNAPGYL